jgi:hypothetical protein
MDTSEPPERFEVKLEQEYVVALEQDFPRLKQEGYRPTSEVTDFPNCIGWALYDYNQYWDPAAMGVKGYYWPPGVPRDDSLASWIKVFEIHGYRICATAALETDIEKIAIYVEPQTGYPQHVARQKKSGVWVSKLGKGADIEHDKLEALNGDLYGTATLFMKRPRVAGAD